MGPAIDGIKFVGGSPHVMTRSSVVELVEIAHGRFVYVTESGLLQHALAQVRASALLFCRNEAEQIVDISDQQQAFKLFWNSVSSTAGLQTQL